MTVKELALSISQTLIDGINKRNKATLVVCGGSSPVLLFNELSLNDLDWSKVIIFLGVDRVVDSTHIDSNEKLIKQELLINNAKKASFISLISSPDRILGQDLPFDMMILGVGYDGHFASLFPSMIQDDCLDPYATPNLVYTDVQGEPPHKRVSMNLAMILNSQRCLLLVNNANKHKVIEDGRENRDLPIFYLLNQTKLKIEIP
jgi:6-phosphogluconolactonase